jgi:DNA-binding response OmpR family regulator
VRVLLVERDPAMLRVLDRSLRTHGFEVTAVTSVATTDVLPAAEDESVGMIVFDLSPFADHQWATLDSLRSSRPGLPLLLLVGGDDCLPKPFALEELIGRIRRSMRATDEPRPTTLVAGDLRLDLLARCCWYGERLTDLPTREFALLEYFVRHPGRVLSRQAILADVWGYDEDPSSNVVDVYVRYLRNRLGTLSNGVSWITTVRGAGYRFDAPVLYA